MAAEQLTNDPGSQLADGKHWENIEQETEYRIPETGESRSMPTLQHRFILASASPRRAELLTRAGYEFDIVPVDVDERRRPGESPSGYVIRLAVDKASAVATTVDGQVVVGADTTVLIKGKILGKPQDPGEAAAMLRQLSGCTHEVLTGVAVRRGATCLSGVEVTRVSFAEIDDDVIAWYVDTGEPLDKAGAYGAQGVGSRFVTGIEGSFTNVVGLPVPLVDRLLSSPELTVP